MNISIYSQIIQVCTIALYRKYIQDGLMGCGFGLCVLFSTVLILICVFVAPCSSIIAHPGDWRHSGFMTRSMSIGKTALPPTCNMQQLPLPAWYHTNASSTLHSMTKQYFFSTLSIVFDNLEDYICFCNCIYVLVLVYVLGYLYMSAWMLGKWMLGIYYVWIVINIPCVGEQAEHVYWPPDSICLQIVH